MSNLVSVILPVYNAEQTIRRAVDSILSQTGCNFELLIIDNASTDGTPNIIHQLAQHDARIRLLYEPKQGIAFALNLGLKNANGIYIARMDADDISFPKRLEKQCEFLDRNADIGLVSGLVEFVGDEARSKGFSEYVTQLNAWKTNDDMYKYRFVESPFAHPSVMFRKSLVDTFGYYSEENIPEDYELWLRWFSQDVQVAKLERLVIQWTDSPERLSRTDERCSAEAFDTVRYNYLAKWFEQNMPTKPIYVWGGGILANKKMKLFEAVSGIRISGIIDLHQRENSPIPHIHFSNLPPAGEIFIISMVSNRGKYIEIEQYLESKGYVYEVDFILA